MKKYIVTLAKEEHEALGAVTSKGRTQITENPRAHWFYLGAMRGVSIR